jgi:DNA-binding transcriptional ArsR family regulator
MATEPDPRLPADQAAHLFALLADETRLRLVLVLAAGGGEVPLADLARVLGVPEPDLDLHLQLQLLSTAGVVTCRREEDDAFYSLPPGAVRDVLSTVQSWRS